MDAAPRAPLRFSKMHGAGNDFVVIDLRDGTAPPDAALCRALADRHTGVGCDQILTIQAPRSAGAVAAYGIWNADGSASQQCGNGARCVAAWIHRDGARRDGVRRDRAGHASDGSTFDNLALDRFALDSPAGTHAVRMLGPRRFLIAMGVPEWAPARIPMTGADGERDAYPVTVDGATLRIGAVSMGNPHAVVEVDDVGTAPVAALGEALQAHAAFPESVNVGFAQVLDRGRIRLRVFERGVGETLACGSGACAAAAVLMRRGRVDRDVDVELPGGTLRIAWPRDGDPITMAGPAAFVFEGEWWQ